jgi:hypothetical protein
VALVVIITVLIAVKLSMTSSPEEHYRHLLWNLNPDDVIAFCGPPLEHTTVNLCPRCEKPPMLRTLTYKSNNVGNVVLEFSVSKDDTWIWSYLSMRNAASGRKYESYRAQALALPCLLKGR